MPEARFENHHHENGNALQANRKALWMAIGITAAIMVVEFAGGILSNSLALMSDAGHMLTDIMSLVLSLIALQLTMRGTSPTRTYGLYRMEILAALVNGTTLILISLVILYEAYRRFTAAEAIEVQTMLIVAAIGLAANILAALAITRGNKENLNIRGAYLHILGDALSSVGVIIGGVIIYFTRWTPVDPIISVAISAVILRGAFVLVRDALNILLEAVPRDIDLESVQKSLKAIPGVKDLHHLHLWTITSGVHALSAHVLIDDILMSRTGQILGDINHLLLEKYRVSHTTVQFECENCSEGFYCNMDRECVSVTRAHHHEH